MIPGEYLFDGPDLELNAGRPVVTLKVNNTGDRPVQIGAHYRSAPTTTSSRSTRRWSSTARKRTA
jgi:urease beta subunit